MLRAAWRTPCVHSLEHRLGKNLLQRHAANHTRDGQASVHGGVERVKLNVPESSNSAGNIRAGSMRGQRREHVGDSEDKRVWLVDTPHRKHAKSVPAWEDPTCV